jgi:FkbM family methyltransferase
MSFSIQIGTNNGKNDDFYNFINNSKHCTDNIILVEPLPFFNTFLKNQYNTKNIYIENIVIIDEEKTNPINFYYCTKDKKEFNLIDNKSIGNPPDYGCSSLDKNLLLSHNFRGFKYEEKDIITIKVNSLTLNQLLDKYNINNLINLFIDAEGKDVDILNSFDLEKYLPTNILFEYIHSNEKELNTLLDKLNKLNYIIYKNQGISIFATLDNESNSR